MGHTYFYNDQEVLEEAGLGETPAEPQGTGTQEPPGGPESERPQAVEGVRTAAERAPAARRKRASGGSEWGAALVLTALVLLLCGVGGMVAWRWQQAAPALDLPSLGPAPALTLPTIEPDLADPDPLERAPTGDGTVLELMERPRDEAKSLQEIYREVNPAVVSVRAAVSGLWGGGEAQGSGVLMTADGYIITNHHVVEGAFRVDVSLDDGRQFQAKLVGSDEATDLAVLKVEAQDLPYAVFGDSEEMEVGDTVAAIGNPMGEELRGTMTDGILSAINRDIEVQGKAMTLLQTTAALNTGNSGGALVNEQGQVIGITNMKLVAANAYTNTLEGLGFAIPTATVKTVVDDLIAHGCVMGRPGLGVTVQPLSAQEREEQGVDRGLWVKAVAQGSDAEGKLQVGDVLLSANGRELYANQDLLDVRDALEVGEAIEFVVWRDGGEQTVTVLLVEQYQIYGK